MRNDKLSKLLHLNISAWHLEELCITQLDRMDVIGALLGVDQQHAASRVPLRFARQGTLQFALAEPGVEGPFTGSTQVESIRIRFLIQMR
jgi:hypothetical protein